MIESNIKELQVKFIGSNDWKEFRDFLVLKLQECWTEKELNRVLEGLVGSMFKNVDEMDDVRKKLQLKHITEKERRMMNKLTKDNEK